ncbi:MAG: biopolymer transporter ExbD [Ignavibacteriaceae bacterium]|nr:biopolymer transporter ExbD [Ignavibacteriaceae bacterium]
MALIKKRKAENPEIQSSSMADVAFMLLLFFIVATTIDVDSGLGITLPEFVDNPEKVEVSKDRMAALLINENGQVLLDGEEVPVPQIKSRLIPRINSKIGLPKNKKLIVSLKTDRKTTYNTYILALDQIKMAFNQARDEYSEDKYGKKFDKLFKEDQEKVREEIPVIISIAEPEGTKKG